MKRLVLVTCATALLAGCASSSSSSSSSSSANAEKQRAAITKQVRERADYWQRNEAVGAQYLTGPKAQHELNKDIASCVAEVRELVRLGSIREATPPQGVALQPGMREGWTSVTRDGPLYKEYTDFQDFDGCMVSKGWERVDYVRPVAANAAAGNFVTTILGRPFGWSDSSSSSGYDAHAVHEDGGTNGYNR